MVDETKFHNREDPICNHCVNEEHQFHRDMFWWVDEDAVAEIRICRCKKCFVIHSDTYYEKMKVVDKGHDYSRTKKGEK